MIFKFSYEINMGTPKLKQNCKLFFQDTKPARDNDYICNVNSTPSTDRKFLSTINILITDVIFCITSSCMFYQWNPKQ